MVRLFLFSFVPIWGQFCLCDILRCLMSVFSDTFSLRLDVLTFLCKMRKSIWCSLYSTLSMTTNFPFKAAFLFPILLSVFLAVRLWAPWNSIQLFLADGSGLSTSWKLIHIHFEMDKVLKKCLSYLFLTYVIKQQIKQKANLGSPRKTLSRKENKEFIVP